MPGPLLHVGAIILCPHLAAVNITPGNSRVLLSGMPVATTADQYPIAGCTFVVGGVPSPCVRVQWLVPSLRVLVNGAPPILSGSVGLCLSAAQVPQGPAAVVTTQPRVVAL